MDTRLKRAPGIYLTGFMGSGKSTVAQALADRLGWNFVDLDSEIERREQSTIADLFTSRGEAEFRRIENELVDVWRRRIENGMPAVVALGGGAFAHPATYELIADRGISVWLDCPLETIEARVAAQHNGRGREVRPLARNPEAFRKLYEERRSAYARADFRVDAGCDIEEAVELILDLPFWK